MQTNRMPAWWTAEHDSAWERAKEALRRDWEQTKHDVSMKSGHEYNQEADDTVRQALGKQPIPRGDKPNPPQVIGIWDEVEGPIELGYCAGKTYGERYPSWNDEVERRLEADWKATKQAAGRTFAGVKRWIRHGYESSTSEHRRH